MGDISKKDHGKDITVSISEKAFAELLLEFLGNKETIRYKKKALFDVRLDDLKQFYYLLIEKIDKEQFTNLNYFSTKVIYNDSTSRELNTIESLERFHETRDVFPTSRSGSGNLYSCYKWISGL